MSDPTQIAKAQGGLTVWHGLAAAGGLSTAGDVTSFALAWVRTGVMPVPDEGQIASIAGLALTVLVVLTPIGKALMDLALAWIKKITPKEAT